MKYAKKSDPDGRKSMEQKTVKLRTSDQAYELIKKMDPDTALTRHAVRTIITSGDIPTLKIGRKTLVDIDDLYEHLGIKAKE